MGKIYEQLRRNIEKLKQIDQAINSKTRVSMDDVFETSVALKKIQYVILYAQRERPDLFTEDVRFPNGEMSHFNIPDNFEDLVDHWEESLGEQRTEHALRHLKMQDEAEPYVPEITPHNPLGYYRYVRETLSDIASVSCADRFGISRDGVASMILSAHKDFVETSIREDFAFDPRDASNRAILEFIDNPIEEVVDQHQDHLMLEIHQQYKDFLAEHQKEYKDSLKEWGHPKPFDEICANYVMAASLSPIRKTDWDVESLSNAVKESTETFLRLQKERAHGRYPVPSMGQFLSQARERVESTLLNHAVSLGDDPNSQFLKSFLDDPITAMSAHYASLGAQGAATAQAIQGQRENYDRANEGKVNLFAQLDIARKNRFERLFSDANPGLDPSRFKAQYQGSRLERLLGRTSPEWNAVADYVDLWQNIGQERDLERASTLAENYLRHKFPNVDPKDVTPEMVNGLRGAGKERGAFCLSLVQAKLAAEAEIHRDVVEAAHRRYDGFELRLHHGVSFGDQIAQDLAEDSPIVPDEAQKGDHAIERNDEVENNNIIPNGDI